MRLDPRELTNVTSSDELLLRLTTRFDELTDSLETLQACDDLPATIDRMLELFAELLQATSAVLCLQAEDGEVYVTHEHLASPDAPSLKGLKTAHPRMTQHVLSSGSSMVLNELTLKGLQSVDLVERGRLKTAILIPLIFRKLPLGLVAVCHSDRPREYAAIDVALARHVAMIAAIYVGTMRLNAELAKSTEAFAQELRRHATLYSRTGLVADSFLEVVRKPGVDPIIASRFPFLTPREREVLEHLDRPNKEIAQVLDIAEHTVKSHVGKILAKLECSSREQALELVREKVRRVRPMPY